MAKKILKLSFDEIKKRFLNMDDVKEIAIDAGCVKSTIYRLMEDNDIIRNRRYPGRRANSNMLYQIKSLPEYKNGRLLCRIK